MHRRGRARQVIESAPRLAAARVIAVSLIYFAEISVLYSRSTLSDGGEKFFNRLLTP